MNALAPKISVLVVIYRMSRQAENTLRSLSPPYQRETQPDEYEIIVVENDSSDELGRDRAEKIAPNIHYYYRKEPGVSPVPALNFAVAQARGGILGIMIDGARMVTPHVLTYAKAAFRMDPRSMVAVPGYHLGEQEHQTISEPEAFKREEARLLEEIDWLSDGYRLFDIACWSAANAEGYLTELLESNCLFCSRTMLEEIGGVDTRFDMEGGGSINLVLYARLGACASRLFMLAGEGSFHQFHGGVTTYAYEGRDELIARHYEQLTKIVGRKFSGVNREPVLLGKVPGPAWRFLERSAYFDHFAGLLARKKGWIRYPLDETPKNAPEPDTAQGSNGVPPLSIILIVNGMSRQARNTLVSLSVPYQRRIRSGDYEIIVVENSSDDQLGRETAESIAPNIRYFHRRALGKSPLSAVEFGLERCQAVYVGLLTDSPHIVTPRVVEYALLARRLNPHAVAAVPDYHLGPRGNPDDSEAKERDLLNDIEWPAHGYRLFDISRVSDANAYGVLAPLIECHCVFASRNDLVRIDGAGRHLDLPDNRSSNRQIWRALSILPETQVVILPGEGGFRQHRDKTHTLRENRGNEALANHRRQSGSLVREPVFLGPVGGAAAPFLRRSAKQGIERWQRLYGNNKVK